MRCLIMFCHPRYLLPLLLALCIGLAGTSAQGENLSFGTHLKLQEASKLTEAGKAREAIRRLRLLEGEVRERRYELAMVQQHLVHAYVAAEELAAAWDTAVEVLSDRQLPAEATHSLTWLVAQIAFQLEDYRSCINYVEQWISTESAPSAKAHFIVGYSYYRLEQPRPAEQHLEQAIELVEKIPDDWRRVLLAVYLDGKRYRKAETVLQSLIEREPDNKSWWKYLVAVYLEQDKEDKALATLVLAYHRCLLETEDLMRIVHHYSYRGIPEKAARLLQSWLKEGRLEASYKTLRLQFELWHFACEHGSALQALEQAASMAKNGEDYLLLGRLHLERNEWQQARQDLQRALHRGVKEQAKAQYLLGIAAFHCDDPDTARLAFEEASKNPKLEQEVAYWSERLQKRSITRVY